jgi:hypothetical protein
MCRRGLDPKRIHTGKVVREEFVEHPTLVGRERPRLL